MRLLKDRKGSLSFFIVFVFIAFILIILFAFAIPLMIKANSEFYLVGQELIQESNQTIQNIQNATIKQQIEDALGSAQQSTADQIGILAMFFQYGWIFVIFVVAFVVYMKARSTVESEIR